MHQSFIGKAKIGLIRNNNMIQQFNFKHFGGPFQFLRNLHIGVTGLVVTGGMVMTDDDGAGQVIQGFFQDDPGIDHRPRESALAHFEFAYDPVGPGRSLWPP